MPRYAITSQSNLTADSRSRSARSLAASGPSAAVVTADTLPQAVSLFHQQRASDTHLPRIVGVEELFELDADTLSDAAFIAALETAEPAVDLDGYDLLENKPLYSDLDAYVSAVSDVSDALRNSSLIPGLTITISRDPDGAPDYSMVEINDHATGTYRAAGADLRDLIADSRLAGRAAILSIARSIASIVLHHRLL